MVLTKKDALAIAVSSLLISVISVVGWFMVGEFVLIPLLILFFVFFALAGLTAYRKVVLFRKAWLKQDIARDKQEFKQTEALLSIYSILKPKYPFPHTRGWAGSPDFLKKLMEMVLSEKPMCVVEASTGVSTLIIGYCLKLVGKGRVISLEHLEAFAQTSREDVVKHGLDDVVTVIYAPLKNYEINGKDWLWYDIDKLPKDVEIDLLVVDGPPWATQDLARYPALPLLYGQMKSHSSILMDDGKRDAETDIAKKWGTEYCDFSAQYLTFEKGAYLLQRGNQ
jgi:hypothetical protein